MWIDFEKMFVVLPGIFIVKDNAITVGAHSYLTRCEFGGKKTEQAFLVWIHESRHTASLLEVGAKTTLNFTCNFPLIYFCGYSSGRKFSKLKFFETNVTDDGFTYIPGSTYSMFGEIMEVMPIFGYYLVICKVVKETINRYGGETWKKV